MNRFHFIAIGGAAMHNLAIALKKNGYLITGSDDEIFEPSASRLKEFGLYPDKLGWDPSRITDQLDGIILGMHARSDNPELLKAKELGAKIYSYPEFLFEQTKDKTRVVIAGSHGKTTITAMIIHTLKNCNVSFDFMVGSQIDGFDTMVSLDQQSEIAVFEGDEYLSSPIDLRPKFIHYKPHIALISGIAWDHINVFPTFDQYVQQFINLANDIVKNGYLVYYSQDKNISGIVKSLSNGVHLRSYKEHNHIIENYQTYLLTRDKEKIPMKIFGRHNLQNINGARMVCNILGITDQQYYQAISTFPGTSRRLQIIRRAQDHIIFLDFAHSPSKLKATVQAVREQYPHRIIIAIFELHTFSSLNKEFIPQYKGTLDQADEPVVFFDKEVIKHKKLSFISEQFVYQCFENNRLNVISDKNDLERFLKLLKLKNSVLLMMSSGNFAGIDIKEIFR